MSLSRVIQIVRSLLVLTVLVVFFAAAGILFVLAVRSGSAFGAAFVAALATVGAALLVRLFERNRVMEAIRREELRQIYNQMAQVLHGQEMPAKKREKLVDEFLKKSLVYASPATLKAYRSWFTQLPEQEEWEKGDFRPNALRYEVFVKAMRKDLGISNWGLQDGDLTRMRIHDFDDYP